jgi:hypothetical protein
MLCYGRARPQGWFFLGDPSQRDGMRRRLLQASALAIVSLGLLRFFVWRPTQGHACATFSVERFRALHVERAPVRAMEDLCSWYAHGRTEHAELLRRMFSVSCTDSTSRVPSAMRLRFEEHGRNVSQFVRQRSVSVWSKALPAEGLAFNRVRAQRFMTTGSSSAQAHAPPATHAAELLAQRWDKLSCPTSSDFCDPAALTMEDARLGHLRSDEAYAFANMGRLTALHGVVSSRRTTNPLRLTRRDVSGMFVMAHEWFEAARTHYPDEAQLPTLTFDLLHAGGASQLHPHLQPHLYRERYPGKWEATRLAACAHGRAHGASYYDELAAVHAHLGLVVARTAHCVAFVGLTSSGTSPEFSILGDGASHGQPLMHGRRALEEELGGLLHDLLRAAWVALGWTAMSSSCAFPPMDSRADGAGSASDGGGNGGGGGGGGLPRYCKLVGRSRGGEEDAVSDISANELFEAPSVSHDVFEAAARIREHLGGATKADG